MEGTVMTGSMLSGMSSGIMDMQAPLQHHQHQHQHQHHPLAHHIQAMAPIAVGNHVSVVHDAEQSLALVESKVTSKNLMACSKGKLTAKSDEDEPSFTEDGTDSHLSGGKSKKNSPWQRMKWTDSMVKLLITVVLCVGEDGGSECEDGNKKKSGILQKKGKWKSVSRFMMDKGCYVSPQQCEDKFNDLNKRYKRLNDILGRGKACEVVENPSILDGMNLPPKVKDDVRKLLSSKHLFFKEMCNYHNGTTMHFPPALDGHQCMQSSMTVKGRDGHEAFRMTMEENEGDEEDEENEDDEDEDVEDTNDENGEDADAEGVRNYSKRRKTSINAEEVNFWTSPVSHDYGKPSASHNLNSEIMGVLQDNTKTAWERRQWMRNRTMLLEEQKVNYQAQAFELEKQRFKWQKFSSKKARELKRMKLDNERMKLENERMALQLRQKELEIESRRTEASINSLAHLKDKYNGREQNELGVGPQIQ